MSMIQRTIKVTTTQAIVDDPTADPESFPLRKWSIKISVIGANGEEVPANVFDKVTYRLHPTFENPIRSFKKAPFKIEEKGWGEFDLNIIFHVAERGGEHTVMHDLNFRQNKYDVTHVFKFPTNKPALNKLLFESGPVPGYNNPSNNNGNGNSNMGNGGGSSDSNISSNARSTTHNSSGSGSNSTISSNANTAYTNSSNLGSNGNHPTKEQYPPHHPSSSTFAKTNSTTPTSHGTVSEKRKSESLPLKPKKKSKIVDKVTVDLERLAEGIQKLGEDDLMEVVQMVTENKTPDTYIRNDIEEGEFHVDLYTLPNSLLKSLWEFISKCAKV
ncbi:SAS complex, SAS5 subunit/transcription initiation factor IID, subunit 14 [Nadsonia fulvescens var. elongata DSM 6958]|uniref:SAS complex, SAS5 subunit/transcription initiation factor IID, subunit 14 n=1 Tax=Nadsonia fulvescens var. elongata DSM 6958 TaxID=857566 RepID=A0A1E3PI18_9ASCO|nr:SAS complex, SAS5 subunit/transcription initiation factor IID, subunit 14 [Nadsonia fulvescens var. elongata DSM 6958]